MVLPCGRSRARRPSSPAASSTAQKARDAFESFLSTYRPDVGGKEVVKAEERKWTMVRQTGDALILVFGAHMAADAEELLKAAEQKRPEGHM